MSKKIIVISLLFVGLLFTQAPFQAQAQSSLPELPSAGLTPNSPFYFFEVAFEVVGEFLTFGAEAKAKLQAGRALERVAEIKAMLAEKDIHPEKLGVAFLRLEAHTKRANSLKQELERRGVNVAILSAELSAGFDAVAEHLEDTLEESEERLEKAAELAEQELEKKFADPAFEQAMEDALRKIAADIDEELGKPLDGFTVIEDETNVDVDDDTYSATHRAESPQLVDLAALRDRILARGVENDWESGDVVLDDDSLDITFEKTYGPINIMGEELFAEASVTISATQNSPETGMTAINYDIDITLESEAEHLLDVIEDLDEELNDDFGNLSDVLKEQMGIKAALRLVRELEEEKQELLDEAAMPKEKTPPGKVIVKDIKMSREIFGTFDSLLLQAKSALAAGNWEEAMRLAKQAEKNLDVVGKTIEGPMDAKEKERGAKKEQVDQIGQQKEEAGRQTEKETEEQD